MKAIIVDDEQSARDILSNLLLRFCEGVEIAGIYSNVEEAVIGIKEKQPDVVFLDIEMPNFAGYEIVNFFDEINFEIIFITAYDKYAIRAFEVSAVDYLLKPIDIERLKKSVQKTIGKVGLKQNAEKYSLLNTNLQSKELKNIVIFEKGMQYILAMETIIAVEAQESYCNIYTTTKKYMVSKNLKHFENILTGDKRFLRIHKSWIISKNHIEKYSKTELNIILTNGIQAKLSKYKKAEFEEEIKA